MGNIDSRCSRVDRWIFSFCGMAATTSNKSTHGFGIHKKGRKCQFGKVRADISTDLLGRSIKVRAQRRKPESRAELSKRVRERDSRRDE